MTYYIQVQCDIIPYSGTEGEFGWTLILCAHLETVVIV